MRLNVILLHLLLGGSKGGREASGDFRRAHLLHTHAAANVAAVEAKGRFGRHAALGCTQQGGRLALRADRYS
jgi:hypothetical protein